MEKTTQEKLTLNIQTPCDGLLPKISNEWLD